MSTAPPPAAAVAALSQGVSNDDVIGWVSARLRARLTPGATLVDVGCGQAALAAALEGHLGRYIGLDVVAYPGAQAARGEILLADLNRTPFPLADGVAECAAAVETIEHLENPRALMRELTRLARPGGWVLVTTPNQLSWLSKMSLVLRHQFTAFQEAPGLYPTHISALLESDLRHLAAECGLVAAEIHYSGHGRRPFSDRQYPGWVSRRWPRGASDNVMLLARKPGEEKS
jgi:2-polyprenyl-3-methyl-5-hydroxy-6-metoxy-1,4-benzoquinol methylase